MQRTTARNLKRAISERYRLWIGLAIGLDAILVFGPPAFLPIVWSSSVVPLRWLIMMIGVQSLTWADREEGFDGTRERWLSRYLVFGFTCAGVLNLLGTFRLSIF